LKVVPTKVRGKKESGGKRKSDPKKMPRDQNGKVENFGPNMRNNRKERLTRSLETRQPFKQEGWTQYVI